MIKLLTSQSVYRSPTFLSDSISENLYNAGYYPDSCGGFVMLNNTIDSTASLTFNGNPI